MTPALEDLQNLFINDTFSSRLAYAIKQDAPTLSGLPPEVRKSMLKVLLKRQSNEQFSQENEWSEKLLAWAGKMDGYLPRIKDWLGNDGASAGFSELANWLVFARFLSQRGGEA
jgi:hypothetical protein